MVSNKCSVLDKQVTSFECNSTKNTLILKQFYNLIVTPVIVVPSFIMVRVITT